MKEEINTQEITQVKKEEQPKPSTTLIDLGSTEYMNPVIWKQMAVMADTFYKSGAMPDDNSAKVMVKIQAGYEMGMKPLESVKSFYFVKGSLNIFGSAIMRRLREHGWKISYQEEPNKCVATISKETETYSEIFTFEEAEKSGWTKANGNLKPGWFEGVNRRLKLRYGATSLLIKTYVPEVLGSATDIAEVAMESTMVSGVTESPTVRVPDGDAPATPSQLENLAVMGIEAPEGITKSQALELLTSKKGKK